MLFIQFLFLLICCTTLSLQQDCLDKFVSPKDNLKRSTLLTLGNFTIQALLQFSEYGTNCMNISRLGLAKMYAIKYATKMFNVTQFPFDIGLQLDDNCGKLQNAMARALEIVWSYRNKSESICRSDFLKCNRTDLFSYIKQASAVIGTSYSYTSIPLSSLMSLYNIPQISPSASSPLLSNKTLYKSFYRTIPSDIKQITVIINILRTFGWSYIFAVGSDDEYGRNGIHELKKQLQSTTKDICLYKYEYIPYDQFNTKDKVEEVVKSIKDGDKAVVVILFLYVDGIGDLILQEAEKQGVRRIWLTSEAWNPGAAETFSKDHFESILNQTHGILSVSLRHYPLKKFVNYIKKEIINDYKCNEWLKNYLSNSFNCDVDNFDNITEVFNCSNNNTKTLKLKDIMDKLKDFPGDINNLIDATTSLCYAISTVVRNKCSAINGSSGNCTLMSLETAEITEAMNKVNFTNEWKQRVSFINGDPESSFYTIENLVLNIHTENLEYRNVGYWDNGSMNLNKSKIQWPNWFNANWNESKYPISVCSQRCKKGQSVENITNCKCCWICHNCTGNTFSDHEMSDKCKPCGNHSYTTDNIECKNFPIKPLTVTDVMTFICSMVGLVAVLCSTVFIFKYRDLVIRHDNSPHMLTFLCVLLFLTFLNGLLNISRPNEILCRVDYSYFYLLLMMYCSFILVKTQVMTSFLRGHAERSLKGNLLAAQLLVLFLFFLLEVVSIAPWVTEEEIYFLDNFGNKGQLQCKIDLTAPRLVSTFIPCAILIIATFCAFRERNADHSFYEPKFLSFSCMALCIVFVAFILIECLYKELFWAIAVNVFGYIFVICFIIPRVYVGYMTKRKGVDAYPMKSGVKKGKGNKSKKNIVHTGDTNIIETMKKQTNLNDPVDELGDAINLNKLSENGTSNNNEIGNKMEEGEKRFQRHRLVYACCCSEDGS